MKYTVTDFKAHCTRLLREVGVKYGRIEVTNHGKVVAVVTPPEAPGRPQPKAFLGSLSGTAVAEGDLTLPVAEDDWEAEK